MLSPQQGIEWSYGELDEKSRCLASGLEDIGYKSGSVAISDVPNVVENLLLQLALSHLGGSICTPPKDAAAMEAISQKFNIRGVVCLDGEAPPSTAVLQDPLPLTYLSVGDGCRPAAGSVEFTELITHCPPRGDAPVANEGSTLGIYGGAALTHGTALALGADASRKLSIGPGDRVCCSVTLMHAFGIASACTTALISGAAVVLPAVGGIKGCGDPKQRASVTLEILATTGTTVLFGDSHTLKALVALPPPLPEPSALSLRTGVIKIGSGNDFLDGVTEIPAPAKGGGAATPLEFLGTAFHAFGKKA